MFFMIFKFWYVFWFNRDHRERCQIITENNDKIMTSALFWLLFSAIIILPGALIAPYLSIPAVIPTIPLPLFSIHYVLVQMFLEKEEKRHQQYVRLDDLYKEHLRKQQEQQDKLNDLREQLRAFRERQQKEAMDRMWEEILRKRSQRQAPSIPTRSIMTVEKCLHILDLPPNLRDLVTIKKKYRLLVKAYHPDVCKASNAVQKFKEVKEAYDNLERVLK